MGTSFANGLYGAMQDLDKWQLEHAWTIRLLEGNNTLCDSCEVASSLEQVTRAKLGFTADEPVDWSSDCPCRPGTKGALPWAQIIVFLMALLKQLFPNLPIP